MKFETIYNFHHMMGPALRESYWQPENYQNYGDLYTKELNQVIFTSDSAVDSLPDKEISARFFWDDERFEWEDKAYYEVGVNKEKQYYPCINLKKFFDEVNDSTKVMGFLENLDKICFSFYDDYYDRQILVNGAWEYQDTIYQKGDRQYYVRRVDYGNNESFSDEIEIQRSEANRVYYTKASMKLAFLKDEKSRIIPVLMLMDMDKESDSLQHFVMKQPSLVYSATSSETVIEEIHPGAQPQLGTYQIKGTDSYIEEFMPRNYTDEDYGKDYNLELSYGFASYMQAQLDDILTAASVTSTGGVTVSAQVAQDYTTTSYLTDDFSANDKVILFQSFGTVQPKHWIDWSKNYTLVYPRIEINSLQVKTPETHVYLNKHLLTMPEEYNMYNRGNSYFINLKPEVLYTSYGDYNIVRDRRFLRKEQAPFSITFSVSNGGTYVYRDALKVIAENSVPKVSYTTEPNVRREEFIKNLYDKLGQVVMINDHELKLENAFGYISSLDLDLDHEYEDSIEVKNYKNKFEDLFSSITAETEEMKKNGDVLERLSAGALSAGLTSAVEDVVATTLDSPAASSILEAYYDANFDDRRVVEEGLFSLIEEVDEILAMSEVSLAELAETSSYNAARLASLIFDATEKVQAHVYRGNPDNILNYKAGDIFIDSDGKQYIAGSDNTYFPFYDGSTSNIVGANLNIDAELGIIDMVGANEINIKSGSDLTIAADDNVTIIGNKEVNIGGCTINIGGGIPLEGMGALIDDSGDVTGFLKQYPAGGINIVSTAFDKSGLNNIAQTSGVFIKPTSIEMSSSNIYMRGARRIMIATSDGTAESTSGIQLDTAQGIFIGSGAGIDIYSGETPFTLSSDDIGAKLAVGEGQKASVSINKDRLLFGVEGNDSGTVIKMTSAYISIGASNTISTLDAEAPSVNNFLSGVKITHDYIGLATRKDNYRNLISLGENGIIFGHAVVSSSGNSYMLTTGNTSPNMLNTEINGSYVQINADGIKLGSLANLYLNTNNVKLQTDPGASTKFAVGDNLNTETGLPSVGIVFYDNNLYVNGDITAKSFLLSGDDAKNDFNNAVDKTTVMTETISDLGTLTDNLSPITDYGLGAGNIQVTQSGMFSTVDYGLVLGNKDNRPMLIASTGGLQIVAGAYLRVETSTFKLLPEVLTTESLSPEATFFYVGSADGTNYLKILKNGTLQFSGNGVFNGTIYATGGTFAGELQAATGTFAGSVNVGNNFNAADQIDDNNQYHSVNLYSNGALRIHGANDESFDTNYDGVWKNYFRLTTVLTWVNQVQSYLYYKVNDNLYYLITPRLFRLDLNARGWIGSSNRQGTTYDSNSGKTVTIASVFRAHYAVTEVVATEPQDRKPVSRQYVNKWSATVTDASTLPGYEVPPGTATNYFNLL